MQSVKYNNKEVEKVILLPNQEPNLPLEKKEVIVFHKDGNKAVLNGGIQTLIDVVAAREKQISILTKMLNETNDLIAFIKETIK